MRGRIPAPKLTEHIPDPSAARSPSASVCELLAGLAMVGVGAWRFVVRRRQMQSGATEAIGFAPA